MGASVDAGGAMSGEFSSDGLANGLTGRGDDADEAVKFAVGTVGGEIVAIGLGGRHEAHEEEGCP